MLRVLTTLLLLLAFGLAACGGDDDAPAGDGAATTAEAPPTSAAAADGCESDEEPAARTDGGADKPSGKVADGATVTFETTCGAFTVELDADRAPNTAQSFASLARQGFYDGTIFHRVVAGFVIQGGDPTGSGMGGPGYSVVEAPPQDLRYTEGVVAMAKTAAEAPGTSGSQFYVVTGEDVGLPPEYALVGKVTEGMDVVQRIGSVAVGPEDRPESPVVIRKATLGEG